MIPFERTEPPARFVEEVERPGDAWLARNPGSKRPVNLWGPFVVDLEEAFRGLCAYSAMYLPGGQVDHFVSIREDRTLAYRWSNYRYATGWINASKKDLRASSLLDPHEVGEDWFEILLPSLQLQVTPACPVERLEQAERMLTRLRLRDDERLLRQRRAWLESYEAGYLSLEGLERFAPLLARAVRKREAGSSADLGSGLSPETR